MTAARKVLGFLALILFFTAWCVVCYPTAFGVLLVSSCIAAITAGAISYIERRATDCGYRDTPFGLDPTPPYVHIGGPAPVNTRIVHTPSVALTVIEGGKKPVWPNSAGAPE